jgi:hypothetical protein
MTHPIDYASPGAAGSATSLPRIGGALGLAGAFIGTAIFVMGCFGLQAAFTLSLIPTILGAVGLVLTFCGIFYKRIVGDDPHVVAALLINLAVLVGGLMEMCIWLNKPLFAGAAG